MNGRLLTDETVDLAVAAYRCGDVIEWRRLMDKPMPPNGLWWDEPGLCSVCGPSKRAPLLRETETYQDHCHLTGLGRGRLCPSCNTLEGMNGDGIWPLWRLTAPWLEVGQRWFYGNEGRCHRQNGQRLFTDDELLSLPMQHLLTTITEHRDRESLRNQVAAQEALHRALFG